MTYTLRDIPQEIETALRARAAAEHKSPEQAILDSLARDLGVNSASSGNTPAGRNAVQESVATGCAESNGPDTSKTTYTVNEYGAILVRPATTDAAGNPLPKRRDLSFLAGTWVDDEEFDAILAFQRQIDPELWK